MSQAQKVLKEAGNYNIVDGSGNDSKTQTIAQSLSLDADDSGKVWLLGNASATFTITLPAVSTAGSGWNGRFLVDTAPVAAHYVVTENTSSDTNIIHGGVRTSAIQTGGTEATAGTGVTQISFLANNAAKGDYIDLVTDGTSWYICDSICQANNAVLFA